MRRQPIRVAHIVVVALDRTAVGMRPPQMAAQHGLRRDDRYPYRPHRSIYAAYWRILIMKRARRTPMQDGRRLNALLLLQPPSFDLGLFPAYHSLPVEDES